MDSVEVDKLLADELRLKHSPVHQTQYFIKRCSNHHGMHIQRISQALHDEISRGAFRGNDVGHVEECRVEGQRRTG
jgi:hypothetical protein